MLANLGEALDAKSALAWEHHRRVCEIESQYKTIWIELADLCISIRDGEEWKLLDYVCQDPSCRMIDQHSHKYRSWNHWLMTTCPCSRSYAYLAIGVREELKDISDGDLREITLGNARILKAVPKGKRSKTLVDSAKKRRPAKLTAEAMEAAPEAHLETILARAFNFSASQSEVIDAALELVKLLEEVPSDEEAIEYLASQYLQENRDRYEAYKKTGVV